MSPPSQLKEAFASLQPIDWSSVPTNQLEPFLKEAFQHAETITNSVPMPPSSHGPPASSSPKKATKAGDTFVSPDNLPLPDSHQEDLHKAWGKPVKLSQKDNPLGVSVYKMSSPDGKGAFFARKSVHQGIPFPKFKRAMEREFLESLKVKEGPGSGAVRGISGDKRIEHKVVDGVGKVDVWQLSSVFPGPVTPREFWSMIVTSDDALSESSKVKSKVPRHYIVISRPVKHSDLSPRSELVKGEYESVELIREVPANGEESDGNPVEWIMVTRSDPGGGIPRFMVERGTPGGIVGDVSKFLDWAITKGGDLPEQDSKREEEEIKQANDKPDQGPSPQQQQQQQAQGDQAAAGGGGGFLAAITGVVATGAVAVGSTVSAYIPHWQQEAESESDSESSVDSSDDDHYSTADESTDPHAAGIKTAPRVVSASSPSNTHHARVSSSATNQSTTSFTPNTQSRASTFTPEPVNAVPSAATVTQQLTHPTNSSERDLLKHSQKRLALDSRYTQQTADLDARAQQITSIANESERAKASERHDKDVRKASEKYEKEKRKIEEKRAKGLKKVEEKRRKAVEKDAVVMAQREVVDWKARCESVEQENEVLRRQLAELQGQIAARGVVAGSAVGGGGQQPFVYR